MTIDIQCRQLIRCDAAKLAECLRQLLGNAAKFTRDGEIAVRAILLGAGERQALQIEASDTGIGIPIDKMDELFRPFGLADSSATRPQQQGLGLGLALTQRLANAMGGAVRVTSTEGKGSAFVLTVPVA